MNLRLKTIIGIAGIEIIMLMTLVLSAVKFLSDSNEQQLLQRADTTLKMFAGATKDAVISSDIATLQTLVDDILDLKDLCYVRIYNDQGRLLVESGEQNLLQHFAAMDTGLSSAKDGVFDRATSITTGSLRHGHIEMGFATKDIHGMLDNAKTWILSIASIEVALVTLFSLILGSYLTRNLYKIKHAAQLVTQEGPGVQVAIAEGDEIGELAKAFNSMSQKLADKQKELEVARKQAESASEAKSRFLASMSHEIRTPMNGVLGLLGSLEQTPLGTEQKELVHTATNSGQLLLSIINDILDFSKMEASTLMLEPSAFDLNESLTQSVDFFKPQAEEKGLYIDLNVSPNVPAYVYGDAYRFKQVLLNLIGNAVKFTEHGGVDVHVHAEYHESRVELLCSIKDSGIGIAEHYLPHLFDEFTMVDQSFARHYEGSGLGLAITQRLLHLMDGNISVQSVEGIGSEFKFSVLFEKSNQSEVDQHFHQAPTTDFTLAGRNLLVVEDNSANQLVIKSTLQHAGVTPDIANNGREAIDAVKRKHYDLILMDISMPEMDGMTATKHIRALSEEYSNVPIVALTAHALSGDKERFLSSGMSDYLSKPFNRSTLLSCLSLHLGDKKNEDVMENSSTERKKDIAAITAFEHNDDGATLVDEEVIQQIIRDTDASVLPELIEFYLQESKDRVSHLMEAANTRNIEALEFESHTLGSSSVTLGNQRLSKHARKIEMLCVEKKVEEALECAAALPRVADLSFAALRERSARGFE
ncbi:putative Signal transduction histidine kinase SypF [Vibrio nigripulchritudo MADA3029]|uniref:HAMP domain-containing hybrid sensor histidine kinase/response regulator n=1 Tax=Vibrio nigripulchritudo TaxID=28173 RepID=UPI0003B1C3D8|nr:response regulator [Vibrio nigripulchritudo]CCN45767.1 putative Signal transduction histidine kinase SypF [Vibrio nigripulchritudo MADA3020]CCN52891.1 putative Signal transduction histidine kinase SypF [Vibrio nigripulchritudo MADA3021]CCN61674.1 putative Signal transduction histidine kinase SypF [Vibrio nigripulchritudo MADA3029]